MAQAEILDDVIAVTVEYREKPLMKMVVGSRWQRAGYWTLPLSWGSCIRLRAVFGDNLIVGPKLTLFGQTERQAVDYIDGLREYPVGLKPFDYQEVGVKFLVSADSALLADEMGLGKTKQTIDAMRLWLGYFDEEEPALVICPNSMKYTWRDEIAQWAPDFQVVVVDGTASKKRKALAQDADVYIINWESIRTLSRLSAYGSNALTDKEKEPGPLNRRWTCVVADEAHRAKDPKAKQTRALWAIGRTAAHRVALSGTPVANTPEDMWSIMHFVKPSDWPSRSAFIDRYCQSSFNFFGGLDVLGINPHTQDELFQILDPHFLRRTKAEVLKSLPPKTFQTRYVELGTKQRKLYKQMEDEMLMVIEGGVMVATSPLSQLVRLNQLAQATPTDSELTAFEAPSCKLDALYEILDEAPNDPLVVFTVSVAFAHLVVNDLNAKGISTNAPITGEMSAEDRADVVREFQAGKFQVIVLTVGAGGEGITLTHASRCVFLQRPWSSVQYKQAQDRIHRVGQESPVQIIDVVAIDTIEERVLDVLDDKDETLQQVCRDPHWVKAALQRKELKNVA